MSDRRSALGKAARTSEMRASASSSRRLRSSRSASASSASTGCSRLLEDRQIDFAVGVHRRAIASDEVVDRPAGGLDRLARRMGLFVHPAKAAGEQAKAPCAVDEIEAAEEFDYVGPRPRPHGRASWRERVLKYV